MRFHRAISVLVLAAFLPLAVGCSSRKTIDLNSDPDSGAGMIADGKPVHISGYAMSDGELIDWEGQVRSAPPDSLEFVSNTTEHLKKGATFGGGSSEKNTGPATFRLARMDVRSLNVVEFHAGRTLALGIPLAFMCLAAIFAVGLALGGGVYGD